MTGTPWGKICIYKAGHRKEVLVVVEEQNNILTMAAAKVTFNSTGCFFHF